MRGGWEIKKLGEFCSSFSGYTPSADLLHNTGKYPYFKVAEMNRPENLKVMVSTDAYLDTPAKIYRKGSIVFPKNGAAISTNKKRILGQDSVVDLNTGGILADDKQILPAFLYCLMQYIDFKQYVRGGAVPTLDIKELKNKECHIPPILEQERIVAELDLLQGIIDKQKAQLKELDTLAQSIFYDMFGDPVENEKGWERKAIGDICVSKKAICRATKQYSKDDGILYIDISSIDNNRNVITSPTAYCFGDAPSRAQQMVVKNDVLISLVRPNLNNVAVVSFDDTNLVASSGFCVLRATDSINTSFLFFIVKMKHFTEYLMQRVSGANYPAVREDDITGYFMIVPPIELQQSFATKIEAIERQKSLLNASIAETQTLFDYTMDKYFG